MSIVHIHKRERKARHHKKLKPYPSRNKKIHFLDRFLLFIGIVGPMTAIPQIYKIYSTMNSSGVSLLTWTFSMIFYAPWILYGIVHKEKPIIITYFLWFIMSMIIAVGTVIY